MPIPWPAAPLPVTLGEGFSDDAQFDGAHGGREPAARFTYEFTVMMPTTT